MLAGRLFPRALAVTWLLDSNAAPLPGRRETMILVEGQPNDAYFPSIGLWRPSLAGRAPPLRCKIALCHLRRELKPLRETPRRSCKWRSVENENGTCSVPRYLPVANERLTWPHEIA